MKVTTLFTLSLLALVSAKNVANLDKFRQAFEKEFGVHAAKRGLSVEQFVSLLEESTPEQIQEIMGKNVQGVLMAHEEEKLTEPESILLQTALAQNKDISIFANYIRDQKKIALATDDLQDFLVVVAPTDHAISHNLGGLKPWEFPLPVDGANEDENIASNLSSFVQSHIIPTNGEVKDWPVFLNSNEDLELTTHSFNKNSVQFSRINGETFVNSNKVLDTIFVDNGIILVISDSLVKP
ncbi:hypothetical protein CAAN1_06S04170 [[Candida] anglica]|uniref:FAS1 domain-containing protein n=1 Tax=[Candida] anglica TaxID=148631 RepID=A0ABP0ELM4_9ASCO